MITELIQLRTEDDTQIPRTHTFSGYRKLDVLRELHSALLSEDVDTGCEYSAELVLAGHFVELWNTFIDVASTHIHASSPLLFVYMHVRLTAFRTEANALRAHEPLLLLREDGGIRDMFTEIVYVIATAPKSSISLKGLCVPIHESVLCDIFTIKDRFRAPHRRFVEHLFVPEYDATDLYIACNELAYCVSKRSTENRDEMRMVTAYWIQWICQRVEKIRTRCFDRGTRLHITDFESGMRTHAVWIIWDIFLQAADTLVEGARLQVKPVLQALMGLFAFKLTAKMVCKKITLLFAAAELLIVPFSVYAPFPRIIQNKRDHETILQHSVTIYMDILHHE
jgi:hypothetical protein